MTFPFMQLVVSIPVLSNTVRVVFSTRNGTFAVAIRDVCVAIGRDVDAEYKRIGRRICTLSELSKVDHFGRDGTVREDYLLPLRQVQNWLNSIPLPPMTTGVHLLRAYRKTLYTQIWSALARATSRKRPFKWTEAAEPDADGNVVCTDEQIGAEHGVSPEVVRLITERRALNSSTGLATWN